jgi:hypothetical protein
MTKVGKSTLEWFWPSVSGAEPRTLNNLRETGRGGGIESRRPKAENLTPKQKAGE